MAHVSYTSSDEKFQIQAHLEPVVESILSKCADSNRFVVVALVFDETESSINSGAKLFASKSPEIKVMISSRLYDSHVALSKTRRRPLRESTHEPLALMLVYRSVVW